MASFPEGSILQAEVCGNRSTQIGGGIGRGRYHKSVCVPAELGSNAPENGGI